jgi:glycosyltransferase involved in cell wall biosynthesis
VSDRLDVLFAGEAMLEQLGGAERFALELLGALQSRGHRVRALVLGAPELVAAWSRRAPSVDVIAVAPGLEEPTAPWARRRARAAAMSEAVVETLSRDRADVVIGQLYAGAGAVAGATSSDVPAVLLLAGYEALCHWAFGVGTQCRPESRCRDCPRALALHAGERAELLRVRDEQDAALHDAAFVVAPSRSMADACERFVGRRPEVAAPVVSGPRSVRPRVDGPVVLVSSVWSLEKGAGLLAPIARRLAPRRVLVQAPNGFVGAHATELAQLDNVVVNETPMEIHELLDGAGVLLVPSQNAEAFGRVALEGLAAGIPTLASDAGGLAEFVPPAQLVRPPSDVDAWVSAVRRLEDPAAWRDAAQDGARAAAAVLAAGTPERMEAWLRRAAREHAARAFGR